MGSLDLAKAIGGLHMNWEERVKKLKADISAIFLALKRPKTPLIAKIAAGVTVAYALSPIDLVPDFIPVLGYLDDLLILPLLVTLTIRLIPKSVFESCREEAKDLWQHGQPKRWYYAFPVVFLWIMVSVLIVRRFW